jgi:hypothetical protein
MSNTRQEIFAVGAYTDSHNSKDFSNEMFLGGHFFFSVTSIPVSGIVTFAVEGKTLDDYYPISSTAITASGASLVRVYPGFTPSSGVVNDFIPVTWRVKATHTGAAGTINYSAYVNLEG